jgi:hypothetical protein
MAASLGRGVPFCLLLNGELWMTAVAPAARWPRSEPLGASASAYGSLNVPVQSTTSATPCSRQGMSLGLRAVRRTTISLPYAEIRPRSSSTTRMSRTPLHPWRNRCRGPYVVSFERYCTTESRDVPTGRPVFITKRSKFSWARWYQRVSLPMRTNPLMPSVRREAMTRGTSSPGTPAGPTWCGRPRVACPDRRASCYLTLRLGPPCHTGQSSTASSACRVRRGRAAAGVGCAVGSVAGVSLKAS